MPEVLRVISGPTPIVQITAPPTAQVLTVVERGLRGPAGPPGSGGDISHEVEITAPASTWTVTVPDVFTRRPNVAIFIDDELVDADVHASITNVTVVFPTPQTGTLVLT